MEDQFNRDTSSASGQGLGTAARMKEQVQEKAVQAKDAVVDFGRKTVDSIDAQRVPAAGGLDQTASTLHQQADKVAGVAHSAADKIQATADYVRHTDLKGMAEDVQDIVKRYPGQSLAAAAILGFLVARGLRSRD
jgi:cell division septum initiation protein DivIVA